MDIVEKYEDITLVHYLFTFNSGREFATSIVKDKDTVGMAVTDGKPPEWVIQYAESGAKDYIRDSEVAMIRVKESTEKRRVKKAHECRVCSVDAVEGKELCARHGG